MCLYRFSEMPCKRLQNFASLLRPSLPPSLALPFSL